MKLDNIANSNNDEFYTPRYAIEPIIKYLNVSKYKKNIVTGKQIGRAHV